METAGVIKTYHKTDCDDRTCNCNERNGIHLKTEYFQNGGKIEGIFMEYDKDGQIWQEINYVNGLKNGIYKVYRSNGKLCAGVNCINDKKEGIFKNSTPLFCKSVTVSMILLVAIATC